MRTYLLLIFILLTLFSCNPSYEKLISNGQYGEAFEKVYSKAMKNRNKAYKYRNELLLSYNLSNDKDKKYVENQLNYDGSNFYKYHSLLETIDDRYEKLMTLSIVSKPFSFQPALVRHDISLLRQRLAYRAYAYYYEKYTFWMKEIMTSNKTNSKNAWDMIEGMRFFYPERHHYEDMFSELKRLGTIYTLIEVINESGYDYNPIQKLKVINLNEKLMVYDTDPRKFDYDRVLEIYIEDIWLGEEDYNTVSREVSKCIEVGQKQEQVEVEVAQPDKLETVTVTEGDSTYIKTIRVPQPPIKKIEYRMVPILETVYATIEDHSLTKNANAVISVYVENLNSNEVIYKKKQTVSYSYSDAQPSYHGDQRALDYPYSSFVSLSSPTDNNMIGSLKKEIEGWTKKQFEYIKKL